MMNKNQAQAVQAVAKARVRAHQVRCMQAAYREGKVDAQAVSDALLRAQRAATNAALATHQVARGLDPTTPEFACWKRRVQDAQDCWLYWAAECRDWRGTTAA